MNSMSTNKTEHTENGKPTFTKITANKQIYLFGSNTIIRISKGAGSSARNNEINIGVSGSYESVKKLEKSLTEKNTPQSKIEKEVKSATKKLNNLYLEEVKSKLEELSVSDEVKSAVSNALFPSDMETLS